MSEICKCGDHLETAEAKACGACINCAQQELAAAQAVIEKLPVYADTGKPFVLGLDKAWIAEESGVFSVDRAVKARHWLFVYTRCDLPPSQHDLVRYTIGPAYSTQAAAEAAKSQEATP